MHLARWLIAAALLALLAAPLPGCRRYIMKPPDDVTPIGGTGGRDGSGGDSGTSGVGGSDSSTPAPPDAPMDVPLDMALADRTADDGLPPDMTEGCGAAGARCCPGNRCANGGCCVYDTCFLAYELCPGESASCISNSCGGICGGLKENCCADGGGYCVRELTVCVRSDAGAKCETCGLMGTPCCRNDYCESGRCTGGRCV
jgi:hypothetical protein